MTLRARLALAVVLITLVPLVAGSLLVTNIIRNDRRDRAEAVLTTGQAALAALLGSACGRVQTVARVLSTVSDGERSDVARSAVEGGDADVVVVSRPDGAPLLALGVGPGDRPEAGLGGPAGFGRCELAAAATGHDVLAATSAGTNRLEGPVVVGAGFRLTPSFVRSLAAASGEDVTLAYSGAAIVSTLPPGPAEDVLDGRSSRYLVLRVPPEDPTSPLLVLLSVPRPSATSPLLLLLAFLAGSGLIAGSLAVLLSRAATRGLDELGAAAERVAAGDLETPIPAAGSGDEVGRLATAFTDVTEDLREHIAALEDSRAQLRKSLTRLGDTLSSTHDLARILEVVLDSALVSVGARAGAILLGSRGDGLTIQADRGLDGRLDAGVEPKAVRLRVGAGIAGRVLQTGLPIRGRVGGAPGQLQADPAEPVAVDVVAVPLTTTKRVVGVLCLYERADGRPFDDEDLTTLRTFATQAAVAVDNVLLHEEAQRLSITDGLTGLWNYRYLTMSLGRELERATRFGRPLALLLLDLDRFKLVNDTHGHQRGDSVLIELAARVSAETRDVDTLARYGGEEFVMLLPETDEAGARLTAERIAAVVRGTPFGAEGEEPLPVTVSIGSAVFPGSARNARDLMAAADTALYAAKAAGRDCHVAAPPVDPAGGSGSGAVEAVPPEAR